ncbi:hypothetical protein [Pedobacter boryungensis]|uniref:YceI-like domain-containing protein n=1 Tax=Pedobacter boryungensis TaxID=869962 RepID=A0ABX2DAL1_9SPHI|nr:hypothetical protein [Pedobacter boryungensis]NQX31005.1 hypothetical protein [Pedobacter boryungensis]
MKNYYNAESNLRSYKSITLFFLVLTGLLCAQITKAQSPYKVEGDSQIKISIDSSQNVMSALSAEGNFIIKDGMLDEINSFELDLPIATNNSKNNTVDKEGISFKLTHVMILPMMKMIHAVGILNVGGVSTRTDLEFNFVMNNDESITLSGYKSIKLSDYHKEPNFALASLAKNNEVNLNMNLIFKSNQFYSNNTIVNNSKMTIISARD